MCRSCALKSSELGEVLPFLRGQDMSPALGNRNSLSPESIIVMAGLVLSRINLVMLMMISSRNIQQLPLRLLGWILHHACDNFILDTGDKACAVP